MITIEMLMEEIEEEIESSIQYAKLAIEYKHTRPALGDLYYRLAPVEFEHAKSFKEILNQLIVDEKNKGQRMTDDFDEKWHCFSDKIANKMKCAKIYMELYK